MKPFAAKLPDALIDAGDGVELRALRAEDRFFLDRLFAEPQVSEWYDATSGDAMDHIQEPTVSPFVIRSRGVPAGYAQIYWANGDAFWRGLGMPAETMGLDLALAPSLHGQGLGPRVVRALTARAFAMDRVVQAIIDPDPDNLRAIRAYSKCGFTFGGPQPGYCGDPMILGVLKREDWGPA